LEKKVNCLTEVAPRERKRETQRLRRDCGENEIKLSALSFRWKFYRRSARTCSRQKKKQNQVSRSDHEIKTEKRDEDVFVGPRIERGR
jgi:hypothetical protein